MKQPGTSDTVASALTLALGSSPSFLHPDTLQDVRGLVRGQPVRRSFAFSSGERAVFRHRKAIPVSQWAERHRVVHESSRPGPWRTAVTPYAAGIMDASFFPTVKMVSIMKCPQSAGTETVHNCIGYGIDRAPGPILYVFPDETTARENAQDRIIPMLRSSPRLREYLTGTSDDIGSLRIRMAHLVIYMAWSGSASRLGNKPIRYLVLDELDKYQGTKREAAAEALAEKRVITWGNRAKIWKLSTPTVVDGPIDRAYKNSEAHFRYHVVCPLCGCEMLLRFEQLRWPEDCDDPVRVQSRKLAWYECDHCHGRLGDAERDLAVRGGLWREENSGLALAEHLEKFGPVSVGFHIPALISPFFGLSEIAARLMAYELAPTLELLKDLQNNYRAEPWEQQYAMRDEDTILALCDDRPRGAVPGPLAPEDKAGAAAAARVSCLLAGVDTQKNHFRYVIRAFGFGELEESWLIQCGIADTLEALDSILWANVYTDPTGTEYRVRAAMIDAMGGRTAEIYRYALKHRGRVYPWQGVRAMTQPYTPTPQEYYPDTKGNKIKIPGGINLWRCDTTFFKNDLAHKLSIHPDDPGAFHLHSNEKGELEEYAREMCAEIYDDSEQAWLNPHGKPNHYWDCEVMLKALAYIRNVRNSRHAPAPKERRRPEGVRGEPRGIAGRLGSIRG